MGYSLRHFSPRGKLNKLLTVVAIFHQTGDHNYLITGAAICNEILSTPTIDILPGLYTAVCRTWFGLVTYTTSGNTEVDVTTECLKQPSMFTEERSLLKMFRCGILLFVLTFKVKFKSLFPQKIMP